MQNILPPPALQGDERAQLTQVYRYLFRLSEQLNVGLSALEQRTAAVARPSGGALSPEGTDGEQFWTEADAQYSSLKSLIIKTANLVRAEMDQIVTNLGSEYVAVSEWGAYKEEVSREIVDTAKYTMENFEYNEEILNIPEMTAIFDSYRIETTGYIKRGIIGFDEENYPILGIAIGQELKHKEVTVGGEVYEVFDESQNMATYAADKLSFWVNGVEVAYLSNSELVVTRIIVSDSIQLGNWDIAVNAADGMTVQKRIGSELDLSENNTFTITADKINAVADRIDLSGNTSIVLTAAQVNAVADQIDLNGNTSIQMIAGQVEQNATDIAANNIHTGTEPPETPVPDGKLWVDTAQDPNVIRRWLGQDVSTERDYTASASGNPVETPPGTASFDSIQSVLLPVQAGSGDPSPDNIRPISGRTVATLTRCGKNLFSAEWEQGSIDADTGANAASGTEVRCGYIRVNGSQVYALSRNVTTSYVKVRCYDDAKKYIGDGSKMIELVNGSAASSVGNPMNVGHNHCVIRFNPGVSYVRFVDNSNDLSTKYQMELGSAATAYEPYTGGTYTADFGQTVYGGTMDWLTGVLTVDTALLTLTGTESYSGTYVDGNVYRVTLPVSNAALSGGIVSSHFRHVQTGSGVPNAFWISTSYPILAFTSETLTTKEAFADYFAAQYAAGTPVQIAYKLATPITIQLPPATVTALKGVNTLHTDADSVSVAYTASGWEIVNDLSEINDVSNRLLAQQAAAQQAIDQLATAITVDSDGAHFYKPGYRAQNEVRIDQDSVDILVGGSVNSSFVAGGLILGNYMLWHPEAAGGLAFNLI